MCAFLCKRLKFEKVMDVSERRYHCETFEKCSILFKFKEGENFNHRNTLSILRIALKLHFVQNVEPDTEIGPPARRGEPTPR